MFVFRQFALMALICCLVCRNRRENQGRRLKLAKLTSIIGMALSIALALAASATAQTQTLTVLHTFTNLPDGGRPLGRLLLDPQGNLYGTTTIGGAIGYGSVFKVDLSGNESVFYSFAGPPDGNEPLSGLIRDASGNLYGTTDHGGTRAVCGTDQPSWAGCGIVFKLDPSGTETVLHRFGSNGPDGANPTGPMALDSSGTLWARPKRAAGEDARFPFPLTGGRSMSVAAPCSRWMWVAMKLSCTSSTKQMAPRPSVASSKTRPVISTESPYPAACRTVRPPSLAAAARYLRWMHPASSARCTRSKGETVGQTATFPSPA